MQSNNPVFRRSEEFQRGGANIYGNQTYAGNGVPQAGYGQPATDPSQWSVGTPGAPGSAPRTASGPMTIDTVVQKTAITLGLVIVSAAVTWLVTGDITATTVPGSLIAALTLGSLVAFALSMVNSFKRVVSPALVLAYAALQGLFIGAMSKTFEAIWGQGIVIGAVLGTVAAVGGTLAAYKFFDIQVGNKFRTWVIGAMFGFVALSLLDLVLGFFHASFGFNGFGGIGLIASVAGLGLGVLMLILDFDFIERGIAAGLPEQESWRAAFGLSVTIVWIYIELLRILAILRNN
jgi:uncharacterized YccA/Bax inhibitor family protein